MVTLLLTLLVLVTSPMALGVAGRYAQAASAACTLTLPQSAQAGNFFTAWWSLGGGTYGTVTRNDGIIVATTTAQNGSTRFFATNVLGPHTYTLAVPGVSSCSASVEFVYTPDEVTGYDIIIAAGQSNAAGVGYGPFSDPSNASIDSKIAQLGRIGASDMKIIPIGYAQGGVLSDGLHFWKRDEGDMGMAFALSFARQYVRKELASGRKVLIVPAAYGGTSILQWLGKSGPPQLPLYADMLARVDAARALPGQNRVVAFLWQQGENDVGNILNNRYGMTQAAYKKYLTELFTKARSDIPAATPYPILAGLMVPTWNSSGAELEAKQAIQRAIAGAVRDEASAAVVSSAGLTSNADIGVPGGTVHFNAKSQVALGKRYFVGWWALAHPTSTAAVSAEGYTL